MFKNNKIIQAFLYLTSKIEYLYNLPYEIIYILG